MRNITEDKTPFHKKFLTYKWVFASWYEKLILVALIILGMIKLFELLL